MNAALNPTPPPPSPAGLTLRPATLTDLDALVRIEAQCFESDRLSRRSFRYMLTKGHAATLIAEFDGTAVGYVMVLFSRGTSMARIYSIAVLAAFRRHTVAQALVAEAEAVAQREDRAEMRLEIRRDNPASIGLFTRLGYESFGLVSDYYEDHMDAVRYQKSLAPQLGLDMVRVPFYAQTAEFTCGPATLMMAMAAHEPTMILDRKLELRLWREATTVFMTSGHGGCGPYGLSLAAWQRGFSVEVYVNAEGALFLDSVRNPAKKEVMRLVQDDMLDEMQTAQIPLYQQAVGPDKLEAMFGRGGIPLVLISSYRIYKEKFPHWVVVTGFDQRFVYMHDPYIDVREGETLADCINMPVLRRDFAAMARYGRSNLKAVVVIYPQRRRSESRRA
ncbi:MAG: peptidase C39 family protein [Thiotrichales bacterium]